MKNNIRYDRKIKVECRICKKIYIRFADSMLNHKVDGTECKCKGLPFIIIEELQNKTLEEFCRNAVVAIQNKWNIGFVWQDLEKAIKELK